MSESGQRTMKVSGRKVVVVAKASAHVHVTPDLLDDPAAFADYVISELRRSEGTVVLSIIREHQR